MLETVIEREIKLEEKKEQDSNLNEVSALKYQNENKPESQAKISIKVYVDRQDSKKYIDLFAAASLGIVHFGDIERYYNSGLVLCELSEEMLLGLRKRFEDRIEYINLDELEDKNFINILESNLNTGVKDKIVLGNYIKHCFDEYKENEDFKDFSNYLEQVENLPCSQDKNMSL